LVYRGIGAIIWNRVTNKTNKYSATGGKVPKKGFKEKGRGKVKRLNLLAILGVRKNGVQGLTLKAPIRGRNPKEERDSRFKGERGLING